MCGIAGSIGCDQAETIARDLIDQLTHRGPDSSGVVHSRAGALATCRLRVRSQPSDPVPFHIFGGQALAAYCGEIYGLRRNDGLLTPPPSGGAAEVECLLSAQRQQSEPDGMYALAIAQLESAAVTLQRDMWGVKPLFWRRMQSGVVFASEQRPLVENLPPLPLNRHAVAEFLAFGRVLGDGSFLEGLYSVPPGGSAIIHNGLMEVRPGRGRASRSHNAQAGVPPGPAELRRAIAESVARTLVSERIVGLAISGGLDSTIIAAELNRLGCEDLATVSVTALDSNDGVREIAQLGLPNGSWTTWHHEHRHFTPEMLPRGIERAVRLLGEPTRMSSVPLYIELAEACTHLGIIVLLSGEGADELFGGYTSYSAWRTVAEAKGTVLDKLEAFALPAKRMSYLAALLGTQSVMLTRTAFRETYADLGRLDAFDALRLLELELSLQPLLTRVDHALMERGVEGRVPFLHGNVPALALALPAEQLCDHTRTKIALRSAYRGILPDRFVDEAKRPFRAPIAAWLAGPLKAWVRARFGIGGNLLEAVGIARTGVEVVVGAAFAGDGEAVSLTFSLLSILAWLEWMIEIEGLDAPDLRRAAACRQGMH